MTLTAKKNKDFRNGYMNMKRLNEHAPSKKNYARGNHELLLRNIFETQIHIQTQIRKNLILALATNDFLYFLLKYRKELSATKLLTKKQLSRNSSFC